MPGLACFARPRRWKGAVLAVAQGAQGLGSATTRGVLQGPRVGGSRSGTNPLAPRQQPTQHCGPAAHSHHAHARHALGPAPTTPSPSLSPPSPILRTFQSLTVLSVLQETHPSPSGVTDRPFTCKASGACLLNKLSGGGLHRWHLRCLLLCAILRRRIRLASLGGGGSVGGDRWKEGVGSR